MLSVLVVYGTRPEAIKLGPVIQALRNREHVFRVRVASTGQHRELLEGVTGPFDLSPDHELDLMMPGQGLNDLMGRALSSMDSLLAERPFDWVVVQGDTTSAAAAALSAYHRRLAVAHVEAGLRSGDLDEPFPEEMNRRVISVVSRLHFAPTPEARRNLLREGVPDEQILVTGNTIVDALQAMRPARFSRQRSDVLLTLHRRETLGPTLERILQAVADLARGHPELRWSFPVHPNPSIRESAHRILGGVANVHLLPPLSYLELLKRLGRSRLVLTDSGGIQEEAPSFGTPVLILRNRTERPEGLAAGVARLVGTDPRRIVQEVTRSLRAPWEKEAVSRSNPYGDGRAAKRIAKALAGLPVEPFDPGR